MPYSKAFADSAESEDASAIAAVTGPAMAFVFRLVSVNGRDGSAKLPGCEQFLATDSREAVAAVACLQALVEAVESNAAARVEVEPHYQPIQNAEEFRVEAAVLTHNVGS